MNEEVNNNYSGNISSEVVNVGTPVTPESAMMNNYNNLNMQNVPNVAGVPNMNEDIPKKKKKWIIPVILGVIVLLLVLGGGAYMMLMSSPKTIFKSSINSLYKGVNNTIGEVERFVDNFDIENKAIVFKGDIKLDSDISGIKELGINLNDFTFGGEVGVDIKNELLQAEAYIKGSSEKINVQVYGQDGYIYGASNLFDGMLREEFDGMDEYFEGLKEVLEELNIENSLNSENYEYVTQAIKDALIKSLDNDQMSKESDTIEILDNKVKVTKYSYTMKDKDVQKLLESILDILLDDDKFIEKTANLVGASKTEVKDELESFKDSCDNIDFEGKISFNIYTSGIFNNSTGFSLEYDKNEYFHYYTDGDNFEFYYTNNTDYEYSKQELLIVGEAKNNVTEVNVELNGEEIANLTVREYSKELIDLDYELTNEKVKGTVYVSYKEEKDSISGGYKFRIEYNGEYISVEGSYGIDLKDKLEKVQPSNIISESDVNTDDVIKKLEEISEKDEAFKTIYDIVYEQYDSMVQLNSYDMIDVSSIEEIKNIIDTKDKAVLYVGNSNMSYKSSSELLVLNNLKSVQDLYGFTSYYYDYVTLPEEFKQFIEGTTVSCISSTTDMPTNCAPDANCVPTCSDLPVIYFIKDGKIESGIRGDIKTTDITEKVNGIGYSISYDYNISNNDI